MLYRRFIDDPRGQHEVIGEKDVIRLQKYIFCKSSRELLMPISLVDPDGMLYPGVTYRIRFTVTEADYGVDVIRLARDPRMVDFRVETPGRLLIDPVSNPISNSPFSN